jgi:hypothetical protein
MARTCGEWSAGRGLGRDTASSSMRPSIGTAREGRERTMIFECESVRLVHDDGTVEAVGVEWTEAKVLAEKASTWVIQALLMAGFGGVLVTAVAWIDGGTDFAMLSGFVTAGLLGAAVWSMWECVHMEGKRRQMLFHADGTVSTTKDGVWNTKSADIEYIQLSQKKKDDDLPYTHGVRAISRRGRVIHVAKNLEPDDAAGLAVMLSAAQEAMRYISTVVRGVEQPRMVW